MEISWKWTDVFMRALTGWAVLLCAVGFVAPSISIATGEIRPIPFTVGIFLSAACATCLLISNAMAANAALMFSNGRPMAGAVAGIGFVGGGLFSMTSMHLGWEVFASWVQDFALPTEDQMSWAFAYIAFAKPGVNWVIQSMKDLKRERDAEETREIRESALEREIRLYGSPAERRGNFGIIAGGAAATTLALSAPMEQAKAFPVEQVDPAGTEDAAHKAHGWEGPRDKAKWKKFQEARALGLRPAEIIRETGLSSTSVYRWWKQAEALSA